MENLAPQFDGRRSFSLQKKGDFGYPPFWGPIFLGLVCHQLGRLGTYGSGATAGSTIWSTSNSKWMACKTFSTMKIPTNANLARKSWPDLPVEIPGIPHVILSYAAHQTWLAVESPRTICGALQLGKSSIHDGFSIGMFDYRRVVRPLAQRRWRKNNSWVAIHSVLINMVTWES